MYDLFPNVDDDVGIELVSRLPFSSLLRFRNINKSWRRIIDSPFFRKLHIEKQLSGDNHEDDEPVLVNLILRIKNQHQSSQELSITHLHTQKSYNHFPSYHDFLNNNIFANSSQPVHGLICFYKAHSTNPIALCNPSLREIKILPSSPSLGYRMRVVGLGYDDLQKDYKIVQILLDEQFRSYPFVEVYSRKRNTWRRVPLLGADYKSYCVFKPLQHAEPSSGAMAHWRGNIQETIDGVRTSVVDAIFSFDMRSDALKVMKITCGGYWKILAIFAKENSSFTMFAYGMREMIIWESEGDQWFKAWKLGPFFDPSVSPVAIWKSNGLILTISSRKKTMLVLCDVTSGEIVKRFEIPSASDFIEYRGSFISP